MPPPAQSLVRVLSTSLAEAEFSEMGEKPAVASTMGLMQPWRVESELNFSRKAVHPAERFEGISGDWDWGLARGVAVEWRLRERERERRLAPRG
jgi:hypothetical protein